jgi:hypothetical protein
VWVGFGFCCVPRVGGLFAEFGVFGPGPSSAASSMPLLRRAFLHHSV